jgi:ADP-ribose pyrophosphatase YjhB (NUDIX family)
MSTPAATQIHVAAAVICDAQIALIQHIDETAVLHAAVPGGSVEPDEPLPDALRRSISDDLGIGLGPEVKPRLLAIRDQMINPPGATPAPRGLHLLYRVPITAEQRAGASITAVANGDFPHLAYSPVVWVPLNRLHGLLFRPLVAALLADDEITGATELPTRTDDTPVWG